MNELERRRLMQRTQEACAVHKAMYEAVESRDGPAAIAAIELLYSFANRYGVGMFDYDAYLPDEPSALPVGSTIAEPLSSRARVALPRQAVFERDGWTCRYCQAAITLRTGHADHVVPWSKGGSDDMANLVASCAACNLSKGARTPTEWQQ